MTTTRIKIVTSLLLGLSLSSWVWSADDMEYIEVEEILNEGNQQPAKDSRIYVPETPDEFVDLDNILYGGEEETSAVAKDINLPAEKSVSLQQEIQQLKQKILETNRDLFILEEDLLFPSSTQVNVFVSFDALEYFQLDSVTIKINNVPVSHHLYTEREIKALDRGAVQRLYTGNLPVGEHEIIALIIGVGPEGRDYERAINLDFKKTSGTKYIQLRIEGDDLRKRPSFRMKQWE